MIFPFVREECNILGSRPLILGRAHRRVVLAEIVPRAILFLSWLKSTVFCRLGAGCSLFNNNCSHKAGLQVQRNTLINNTMYITKRYKIFKSISINNNLALRLVPKIVF